MARCRRRHADASSVSTIRRRASRARSAHPAGSRRSRMYPGTHAATRPDHPAVIMAGSGERLTYAELDERSIRLANAMRAAGLRRGDTVALLTDNSLRAYEVYW